MDAVNDLLVSGECVDVFYMDFQKAFDTVPHYRLIEKLKGYGITGNVLGVIADFLSGRLFNVRIGDAHSCTHPVTSGVPQGSVLGPILFLLYINDLPEVVRNSTSLFADDVKMFAPSSTQQTNQQDIDQMCDWQDRWLLSFNTRDEKCKVMHLGKNNPHNCYYLRDLPLPVVTSEKDLGVNVDNTLDWTSHINKCVTKAKSMIYWVTRNVITRSASVMINLYKTIIRPHLEYCVQLWAPYPRHGNWPEIMLLEGVQRQFTRLIDGVGLLSYEERLKSLELTTLLERRARGDLIETFRIVSGICNYGQNLFNISRYGLKLVTKPNICDNRKYDFFSRRVIGYWNKLPLLVRTAASVDAFKSRLRSYKHNNIDRPHQYWELSQEIFSRIDNTNRGSYVKYMRENPYVAKRKGVSTR